MKKIIFAVLFLTLAAVAISGQDRERTSLKGLRGIGVWVELTPGVKDELNKIGISLYVINEQVTLRLRKAGIRVLENDTDKQSNTWSQGWPHLVVELNYDNRKEANLAWLTVSVHVEQWVLLTRTLTRNSDQSFLATTWKSPVSMLSASDSEVFQATKDLIGDAVDSFINAYLAENPKTDR
jgi:hypothetical protein